MASPVIASHQMRRIELVQRITILWMSVEAAVALSAAWMARSPALVAFGGDSAIELVSAVAVLWRFRKQSENAEKRAARITGLLLFALAAYVVAVSVLSLLGRIEAQPSYVGIALLVAAAVIMPFLAAEKRRISVATGSAAMRADAAESALCAYLSFIALVGLVLNSVWQLHWADPAAALLIVPLIVREGRESMRGRPCGCCPSPEEENTRRSRGLQKA